MQSWKIRQCLIAAESENVPSTKEMSALEELHQRFRCRQADQRCRHEFRTGACLRWSSFDVPRAWCIDSKNRDLRRFQCFNDLWKWFAHLSREREAKDGINDQVRLRECSVEVIGERNR